MKKLLFILILFCSIQGFGQIKGYWRLNGNSNDASGNGNNGTATNVSYVASGINGAASMNGTSSKIMLPNLGVYGSSPFTFSAWIYVKSLSTLQFIFSAYTPEVVVPYLSFALFYVKTDGSLEISFSEPVFVTASGAIQMNKWYYVSFSYIGGYVDSTSIKCYINGVEKTLTQTYPHAQVANISSSTKAIGYWKYSSSYYYFNGFIDEVIIDNTAWSPAKVKNEYIRMLDAFSN